MNATEERLARMHGRSVAKLVGSGTMGLMLGLQALGVRKKAVAVPNNVCFSVIQAILYSGNIPLFLDIDEDDFGLSPEVLVRANGFDAVIAVHAYGRMCKIETIAAICKRIGVPLIEDLAVAQGAGNETAPAGAYGDLSVLSFGAGKIIDIGHGGAVFSDDPELIKEIVALSGEFSIPDSLTIGEMNAVSQLHTHIYNEEYLDGGQVQHEQFVQVLMRSKKHYTHGFDGRGLPLLEKQLNGLEKNLACRHRWADHFYDLFSVVEGVVPLLHRLGDVYWRFNLLIEKHRDRILKKMLRDQLPVSSWHPPTDIFFHARKSEDSETPVCDKIGEQILNLWVNDAVDDEYPETVTRKIREEMGKVGG